MSQPVVVMIPDCAPTCPLVTMLLVEIARLRGTSEQVQQTTHGIDDDPPRPHP
jgi:hypothetical protein